MVDAPRVLGRLNVRPNRVTFNVMVAGQSGNGKTTAISALLRGWKKLPQVLPSHADAPKTTKICIAGRYEYLDEGSNTKLCVNVIDTPGYGDTINNSERIEPIKKYVHDQLAKHYEAENSPEGLAAGTDDRIHVCLYFVSPQRMHELDKEFMRKLQEEVPIVPLIAKADTVTDTELKERRQTASQLMSWDELDVSHALNLQVAFACKSKVTSELKAAGISWYDFDLDFGPAQPALAEVTSTTESDGQDSVAGGSTNHALVFACGRCVPSFPENVCSVSGLVIV